jgi:hypothetical protein
MIIAVGNAARIARSPSPRLRMYSDRERGLRRSLRHGRAARYPPVVLELLRVERLRRAPNGMSDFRAQDKGCPHSPLPERQQWHGRLIARRKHSPILS